MTVERDYVQKEQKHGEAQLKAELANDIDIKMMRIRRDEFVGQLRRCAAWVSSLRIMCVIFCVENNSKQQVASEQ